MKLIRKYRAYFDRKISADLSQVQAGSILPVFKLFSRYYFKSIFGPFFTFFFPVIIYGILGSVLNPTLVFAGFCAMAATSDAVSGMPFAILEIKKSVLLKRIGASPVRPSTFTFIIISFYAGLAFISILWMMLWSQIFFQNTEMFKVLGTVVGFFGFLYGNAINTVLSLAIGFAIATYSKTEAAAQAIGLLAYFPLSFLSGQFFPIEQIGNSEGLQWASRFTPTRYTTMYVAESWNGDLNPGIAAVANVDSPGNPFLIHNYYQIKITSSINYDDFVKALTQTGTDLNKALTKSYSDSLNNSSLVTLLYDKADHIVGYIYPYVAVGICSLYSVKRFNWSSGR